MLAKSEKTVHNGHDNSTIEADMIDRTLPSCLFFDLDGTLSVGGKISDRNKDALCRVQAAGHKIFLNTGRSRANIPPRAFDGIAWDGIAAGYSYAEVRKTVVLEKHLSKEALLYIRPFCDRYGFSARIQGVKDFYVYDHKADPPAFGDNLSAFINENYESMRITNLDICGMTGKKDGDLFPGCRNIYQSGYMEVHRDDCDKSSGIKAIAAYLGIPLGQTVSFGDSSNDIDMLRCTGTSVIMHAAPESLNDFAALRTESDEDGVAEAIDKLFFE